MMTTCHIRYDSTHGSDVAIMSEEYHMSTNDDYVTARADCDWDSLTDVEVHDPMDRGQPMIWQAVFSTIRS